VVTIDPLELEAAQEKDGASANRHRADDEPLRSAPTGGPAVPDATTPGAGKLGHVGE